MRKPSTERTSFIIDLFSKLLVLSLTIGANVFAVIFHHQKTLATNSVEATKPNRLHTSKLLLILSNKEMYQPHKL